MEGKNPTYGWLSIVNVYKYNIFLYSDMIYDKAKDKQIHDKD